MKRKKYIKTYISEEEKLELKKHIKEYGYISQGNFLRLAYKNQLRRDKKGGSA